MKLKKHRVWTNEEHIIKAIDRSKAKVKQCQIDISLVSLSIRTCQDLLNQPGANACTKSFLTTAINTKTRELERLQKKQARAQGTLPGLKQVLASFRTKTFDFMGDYKGVVAK